MQCHDATALLLRTAGDRWDQRARPRQEEKRRANKSNDQREKVQAQDRTRKAATKEEDTVRRREARANMPEEQREQIKATHREEGTRRRANMPPEQREQVQARDREHVAEKRLAESTNVKFKELFKIQMANRYK